MAGVKPRHPRHISPTRPAAFSTPIAWSGPLQQATIDGFTYEFVEQRYKEALGWSGFCGGSAETSLWLSRDSIVGYLRHLGYRRIEFDFEAPDHPNGPAFALYAER